MAAAFSPINQVSENTLGADWHQAPAPPVRQVAEWPSPRWQCRGAQRAVERGMVTLEQLAGSAHRSLINRSPSAIRSGVSWAGGPRKLLLALPLPARYWYADESVRARTRLCRNTVSAMLPAGDVLSADGSASGRRPALTFFSLFALSSRLWVEHGSRSSRDCQPHCLERRRP